MIYTWGGIFLSSEISILPYRQIVERYCHIINGNAIFARTHTKEESTSECLNLPYCEKNGGCRNRKYLCRGVSK